MNDVGIDISGHASKTLHEVGGNWDYVITVCDSANEACPLYPEKTTRLHVSFPDPSGKSLAAWATVRDGLKQFAEKIVQGIVDGKKLAAEDITVVVTLDE